MATAYSSEVSVGSYNRIRIKCDYSGTSATLTIQFRRTSSYSTTWSNANAKLTFNGTTKNISYSYTGTVGTSWVNLKSNITGYSVSVSGGTYSWNFSDPGGVLGCSGSITIPAQSSAPSNPTVSNVTTTEDTLTATLDVASWGNPTSGRFEYYFGTTPTTTDNYTLNPASGYTSNRSVEITRTGLTPDTDYYIRVRVWNNALNNPGGLILSGPYRTSPAVKLYGSVNGEAKRITRLYGSVNGQTVKIDKIYGPVNGQTKLIYQG